MGLGDGDRGVPSERPSTFSVLPVCAWEGITVGEVAYGSLASVYEWLVPDAKASPAGSAQAFEMVTAGPGPGAQILDCACGIGLLAVGLAQAGFRVTACDASPAMAGRTRALARAHRAGVPARVCRWDQLPGQGWQDRFGAVLCAGNSLAHAAGRSGRRAAIDGMAFVLATGGVLALTSRNWEQIRSAGQPAGRLGPARGTRRPQGSGGVLLAGAAFMGDRTPPADLRGSTPRR